MLPASIHVVLRRRLEGSSIVIVETRISVKRNADRIVTNPTLRFHPRKNSLMPPPSFWNAGSNFAEHCRQFRRLRQLNPQRDLHSVLSRISPKLEDEVFPNVEIMIQSFKMEE